MKTDFGALNDLQKKLWSTILVKQGRDNTFWISPSNGLLGKGLQDSTKPIHYVNALTKVSGGTKAVVPLVLDLIEDGQTGDNQLEGNEEEMTPDAQEIRLGQLRHAVKNKGKFSDQQTVINFRSTAKDTLGFWMASKQDELFFLIASGVALTKNIDGTNRSSSNWSSLPFASQVSAPTAERAFYAGTATSTATITAGDIVTWNLLCNVKAQAVYKRLKPIRVNGKPTYIVVMHPLQVRDLKKDTNYINAQKDGNLRGADKNPLFTGAVSAVDGLIIHEHNKVTNTFGLASGSKWGSGGTIDGATALLVGAQALGYAFIGTAEWKESDQTDYGNQMGIATSFMFGIVKNVYKDVYAGKADRDFAIMTIQTACNPLV